MIVDFNFSAFPIDRADLKRSPAMTKGVHIQGQLPWAANIGKQLLGPISPTWPRADNMATVGMKI
jgi:hypothetical protein